MTENKIDINEYRREIGNRIYETRKKLELTLSEFGNQIEHKVNASVVQKWERGISIPSDERVIEISQLGNVSVSWLLYGFDYKNLQNHKLPDSFRTLERFENNISSNKYTEIQLKHIDQNVSETLTESLKRNSDTDNLYLSEIFDNPAYRLQQLINYGEDNNPTPEQLREFNFTFSLICQLLYAQYHTIDNFQFIKEIIDKLVWLSGTGPETSYIDNDIFKQFIDKDGLSAHIDKVKNNLFKDIDNLAELLKETYVKPKNN